MPEEKILEIYRALRPGRAGRESLYALADELEARYGADALRSARERSGASNR